jgi:hypothetical protein
MLVVVGVSADAPGTPRTPNRSTAVAENALELLEPNVGGSESANAYLLCHVLLGRPFPVSEATATQLPEDGSCVEGYDSHYALLRKERTGPRGTWRNRVIGVNRETREIESPDTDQISIYNPCQALPRYIVFARNRTTTRAPDLSKLVVLWTDPKPMYSVVDWLNSYVPEVCIHTHTHTHSLSLSLSLSLNHV